jgi:N-acetylmuramoyl-L-alanine amidase
MEAFQNEIESSTRSKDCTFLMQVRKGTFWTKGWVFVVALCLQGARTDAARLTQAQIMLEGERTQLILEFDGPFQAPTLFALDSPKRIAIDLPGVSAKAGPAGASGGLIASTRIGSPSPGISRLVIDLARGATVQDSQVGDPITGTGGYRLMIVLAPGSDADFAKLLGRGKIRQPGLALPVAPSSPSLPPPPSPVVTPTPVPTPLVTKSMTPVVIKIPTPQPTPTVSPPVTPTPWIQPVSPQPITVPLPPAPAANPIRGRIPVIVIDPGHGGHDPGAPSVLKGRVEKEAALGVAKALKAELEKTGKYKVLLTRDTDVFVPFRDRTDLARKSGADLFLSIHCDSISDPTVRGSTIYTLSDGRADKEAERLAAAENKADYIGGGINIGGERDDVVDILFSLVQRETRNFSAEFAEYAARELSRFVLMRPRYLRAASLIVLTTPDVPSVLIETGYVTSPEDSAVLFSGDGQRNIARGISKAIDIYFGRRVGK